MYQIQGKGYLLIGLVMGQQKSPRLEVAIDFVESVMDGAFAKIGGQDDGFDSLSKTDKIKKFASDCLGNPTTGAICQVTYEAIMLYMGATLS